MPESGNYVAHVKGSSAEDILANVSSPVAGPVGEYLRIAAQVRSNQELATALTQASEASGRLQC